MTANELLERGTALRVEGRFAEAIRLLDQAAQLNPSDPDIWLERGIVFDLGGSLDKAAQSYAEAVRLGGGALPLAGYASVAVRKGDYANARQAAEQTLILAPGEPVSTITLARCDLEAHNFAAAEHGLRALLDTDLSAQDRMIATGLLGDVLDKQERTIEAFAAYTDSKNQFAQIYAPAFVDTPPLSQFYDGVGAAFAALPPERWTAEPDAVAGTVSNHIFLIGHPRSGTTLVENILASAPGVAALEERQTLRDADADFFSPPQKLAALPDLDETGLRRYREAYWRRVRMSGVAAEAETFIDMDPVKGSRLPIIARLFPEAKIVVMRRDPRDVVLSCFRTNFAPNASAYQFATLEGAALHYDALMRLQQQCLAALPLAAHHVSYENLIANFDTVTQELCEFVGIAWSEGLRRFDKTAERRGVTTASQTQVRRGLYDGRAQWRRYEEQLAPVMPILQPWIDEFGYAGTP